MGRDRVDFEAFVDTSNNAMSKEELYERFISAMAELGYDRINFSIKQDFRLAKAHMGLGLINTYPRDWQAYYAQKNYQLIDPVLKCATNLFEHFTWAFLERRLPLTRHQREFMRLGEDAGLYNGVGLPFDGPRVQIGGIALATSSKIRDQVVNLDLIKAYTNQFRKSYQRLVSGPADQHPFLSRLSAKELQVLQYLARNLTNLEIGYALGITENTVRTHVSHIYEKLEVNNRTGAAIHGLIQGMIEP